MLQDLENKRELASEAKRAIERTVENSSEPLLPHFQVVLFKSKILTVSLQWREKKTRWRKAEEEPAWWSWRCFVTKKKKKKARDGSTRRVSCNSLLHCFSASKTQHEVESASDTHFHFTHTHSAAATKPSEMISNISCAKVEEKVHCQDRTQRFSLFFSTQFIKIISKPQWDDLSTICCLSITQWHKN